LWAAAGVRGVRTLSAAPDPATAILEVAVHKTFRTLDTVPHVLTSARIVDASRVHLITATDVPNANWLRPGAVSAGQQAFGDTLMKTHRFVLIPSAVSSHSWILICDPAVARGFYGSVRQERSALDTRLHPPADAGA
jgi:RES domain-containing protein